MHRKEERMARFRRKEICSGWALEQYGEHRHSFILIAPHQSNIKSIQNKLSSLPGGSDFFITNDVLNGTEIFFRCDLSFKQTIIKVAELLNLPYTPPAPKKVKKLMKPVKQYTLDGEYIRTWDGASVAGETLGIRPSGISNCAGGRQGQAGGYIWKKV